MGCSWCMDQHTPLMRCCWLYIAVVVCSLNIQVSMGQGTTPLHAGFRFTSVHISYALPSQPNEGMCMAITDLSGMGTSRSILQIYLAWALKSLSGFKAVEGRGKSAGDWSWLTAARKVRRRLSSVLSDKDPTGTKKMIACGRCWRLWSAVGVKSLCSSSGWAWEAVSNESPSGM